MLFSPYISTQVVAKADNRFEGGVLFGVNFNDEVKINEVVAKALKDENLSGFDILVGSVLADELNLHKNDKLSLIFSNLSPSGFSLVPQAKRFDVKARFTSGLIFYDKAYMYTDVNALRKVLGISNQQSYDGVHVYSENAFKDVEKLKSYLKSDYAVVGW